MEVQRLFREIVGATEAASPASNWSHKPIFREAGLGYVIYDDSTVQSTSNPAKDRHRGWIAYLPNGKVLGFLMRQSRWKRSTPLRYPRRFRTPEAAMAALETECIRLNVGQKPSEGRRRRR